MKNLEMQEMYYEEKWIEWCEINKENPDFDENENYQPGFDAWIGEVAK